MPKVNFSKPFKFAERGTDVIEYPEGEHEVSDRCAECAELSGALEKAKAPTRNKAARPTRNKGQ